ncbi:MarR family transcriptional regulator [Weissella diestrammenae]|uniref:MarR family transcriptional regulator n=1 Tax=Weissella diestrammenae TaxID=1162633 RepID=A0A7G9T4V2_9LACO|nr:MarR family transcriptional regulator [Weissella diestrammenae]MCM0582842.1 MarR family transcriptional regulator [Weissella diestrammenae]QNN75127.1 MarR family transcriptional regulator [Weissella diestrammenae]
MENQELFDQILRLTRQPSIWFTAMINNLGRDEFSRPDNSRRLLRILSTSAQPISAGTIADILAIRPASVTQLIKKLVTDEYVERIKDAHDARIVLVQITDLGRQYLEERDAEREDFERDLFSVFDAKEREQFTKSLVKLNEHVGSESFIKAMTQHMDPRQRQLFAHLQKNNRRMNVHMARGMQHARRHMGHDEPWHDFFNDNLK